MHIVDQLISPTASFVSTAPVCDGEAVTFTNMSEVGVPSLVEYLWDFGDGNTSTDENPTHLYASAGTYTVTLTVTQLQTGWADTAVMVIEILAAPTADFDHSVPACVGLDVTFSNLTTGAGPFTYLWGFGDGITSTLENPVHAYGAVGLYDVTLAAFGFCGDDEAAAQVDVLPLPTAGFTYTVAGMTVGFTNASSDADTYLWDFGDGMTDTVANPVHTYSGSGTYDVSLTVTGACGTDLATMQIELAGYTIYLPVIYRISAP